MANNSVILAAFQKKAVRFNPDSEFLLRYDHKIQCRRLLLLLKHDQANLHALPCIWYKRDR